MKGDWSRQRRYGDGRSATPHVDGVPASGQDSAVNIADSHFDRRFRKVPEGPLRANTTPTGAGLLAQAERGTQR